MQTFDNTRPLVAGMAIGVARACLERTRELLADAGIEIDYDAPPHSQPAAASEFIAMESDWEAARLLTLQAAWMADNRKPNSLQASMAKAKAGRTGTDIALRCVALCGRVGYGEGELLEKWARDVKILDIFEGTQQIQLLIVARLLLGRPRPSSSNPELGIDLGRRRLGGHDVATGLPGRPGSRCVVEPAASRGSCQVGRDPRRARYRPTAPPGSAPKVRLGS